MEKMSLNDVKLIEQLAQLTQGELQKLLYKVLSSKYKKVVYHKSYLYAEGTIPIILLAHMDTVFPKPPENIFYDQRKTTLWSSEGLGADDRAGVFAICKILSDGFRPHIVFTTDEEIGCVGASVLAKKKKDCPFKDVRYAIQLDRRGKDDCVFYDCDNPEFTKYVEKFDFLENWGSCSDISILCPAWKCAGTNLSVGYEDEHTKQETLNTTYLLKTIRRVEKMLSEPIDQIPTFEYIENQYTYPYCWGYGYDDAFYQAAPVGTVVCEDCLQPYQPDEIIPVYMEEYDITLPLCIDCFSKYQDIQFCEKCGTAYIPGPTNTEKKCKHCLNKIESKLI